MINVELFYNVLYAHDRTSFLWKDYWRDKSPRKIIGDKAPSRVNLFILTMALGKMLTQNTLRNRGM